MTNHGIRISTYGNNADKQQRIKLSYSSDFSTLKIYKRGHISITTSGSGLGTKRIPHGLRYAPAFYVWRKDTSSFSFLDGSSHTKTFHPAPGTSTPWIGYHATTNCYTDNTNLTISIQGANSTTYHFVYYIFIDQAEFNQSPGLNTTLNHGLKVSKQNENVDSVVEQKTQISSSYGILQYYPQMITDYGSITLPAIAGDYFDQTPREGTYIDFMHTLRYPPFFMVYAQETGSTERTILPMANIGNLFGSADYALTAWCSEERIRITFYRRAQFDTNPSFSTSFSSSTLSFRIIIFTENLELK